MNTLEVKNISKTYGKHLVLDNISISVPENKIYGLLGPNGAGKTTLIRIINQIINSDNGEVLFRNKPISRKDVEKMGYLPEERGLYTKMKVGEHLLYMAQLKGMKSTEARSEIKKFLVEFEIHDWWNKKVEQLSKGMQQKLQFILAIMHNPEFIILDEPFTGFDPVNAELIKNKILELKEKGTTFMISTHRMESVEELCDYVTLINKAQKVLDGNKWEIREKYSKNMYEVVFRNKLSANIPDSGNCWNLVTHEVKSKPDEFGKQAVRFQLLTGFSVNDLLADCLKFGEIYTVNEIIPSMSDIFISLVNGQKHE